MGDRDCRAGVLPVEPIIRVDPATEAREFEIRKTALLAAASAGDARFWETADFITVAKDFEAYLRGESK